MARPGKQETSSDGLLWTPTDGQDLTKSYFPLSAPTVETCEQCGKQTTLCRRDRVRQRWVCLACIEKEAAHQGASRAPARLLRRP